MKLLQAVALVVAAVSVMSCAGTGSANAIAAAGYLPPAAVEVAAKRGAHLVGFCQKLSEKGSDVCRYSEIISN